MTLRTRTVLTAGLLILGLAQLLYGVAHVVRVVQHGRVAGVPSVTALIMLGAALTATAVTLFATRALSRAQRTADLRATNRALEAEVDERRRVEEALRASEGRFRTLVDTMADAVFALDVEGRFRFANPRAETLTGYPAATLLTMSFRDVLTPDSIQPAEEHLADPTADAAPFGVTFVEAQGREVSVELAASPLFDSTGRRSGTQWIARDVTDRRRFEAQLMHMASHDFLTGLYNRQRFEEEFDQQINLAKRHGTQGSVLWLDLDHFKEVNDSLGHRAGDTILMELAALLKERLRGYSVLARLGGDEFAVLLPQAGAEEAEATASRIVDEVRDHVFMVDNHSLRLTASVGLVRYPEQGTEAEELLARADLAMYHAKEDGRNRFCVYRPSDQWQTELSSRIGWIERIDGALREGRMLIYAQPILDLATDEVDRYELLLRLQEEDGTIVAPGDFLPAAERIGSILAVDYWMLGQTIRLIAEQRRLGRDVKLDVNLSGKAFSDVEVLSLIRRELDAADVSAGLLGIEITETAAVADVAKAQQFIETLKGLGCRVALDDFGSGFSSFYYLKHLPIDGLKIDGSFVHDITSNEQDQHLVRAMLELSRGLGLRATAEFVEDEATLQLLRSYGMDEAQGYHIAEPKPVYDYLT